MSTRFLVLAAAGLAAVGLSACDSSSGPTGSADKGTRQVTVVGAGQVQGTPDTLTVNWLRVTSCGLEECTNLVMKASGFRNRNRRPGHAMRSSRDRAAVPALRETSVGATRNRLLLPVLPTLAPHEVRPKHLPQLARKRRIPTSSWGLRAIRVTLASEGTAAPLCRGFR